MCQVRELRPSCDNNKRIRIQTNVILISGNPGVIEFYDSFLDALHLRYKERGLAIIAHGMLGHAPQLTTPKLTGLLHQVESLIQLLKKIKQEWSKVRVVAISHSVGAWVVMQVFPVFFCKLFNRGK